MNTTQFQLVERTATLEIRNETRIEYLTDSGEWTGESLNRYPSRQSARDEIVRQADWCHENGRDFDPTRYRVTSRTVVMSATEWKDEDE